jgi:uncharacterized membrane protein
MESRAKFFGHPVHQMLIVFPLGLLATTAIFDLLSWITASTGLATAAYYTLLAGVISGVVAAPFGLIDWLAIPANTRAKSIGGLHGAGNVVVLGLFTLSWFGRRNAAGAPETLAYILSWLGAGLALGTGWLGGELVDRLGIGVDPGAHVNAPSSLSERPAHEDRAAVRRER